MASIKVKLKSPPNVEGAVSQSKSFQSNITDDNNAVKGTVHNSKDFDIGKYVVSRPTRLIDLADIDSSAVEDGAMLLYSEEELKFVITNQMNNANTQFNGGHY